METLFWLVLFFFIYTWVLYPAILSILPVRDNSLHACDKNAYRNVSVIIPVHNGQDAIKNKVNNIKQLDYPQDLLEIIIVSDGSTDETINIVRQLNDSSIILLIATERSGKSVVQNLSVEHANSDILLFTDVDSTMEPESLTHMFRALSDEKVGCVGANVQFNESKWQLSDSQSIYQHIEERIRKALSRLGWLISINGSAFLVKKKLFKPLDADTGDDFIIPLDLALEGYMTVFAERAIVYDYWPGVDFKSEINARRRITLRNFTGLLRRKSLLNPVKYPGLSMSLISHKVLRWLSPILLILVFAANFLLLSKGGIYEFIFVLQVLMYIASLIGLIMNIIKVKCPVLGHLGMFLLVNMGLALGLVSLLRGTRISAYKT